MEYSLFFCVNEYDEGGHPLIIRLGLHLLSQSNKTGLRFYMRENNPRGKMQPNQLVLGSVCDWQKLYY